uniref:Uncharacterized protein n=1 Tax=Rhizophora mucronata TaxID=61149 RepID=A0A2P2Q7U0_RHIMU
MISDYGARRGQRPEAGGQVILAIVLPTPWALRGLQRYMAQKMCSTSQGWIWMAQKKIKLND